MRCPACGEENPGRAKFCLECGSALDTGGRESRRVVTVVFADMVGSTALGERLDPESLRRVMDSFYVQMRAAIESERGTLTKFIGDAVLAVWGTPEVGEDDALRAVRAAVAMRAALVALNADLGARFDVRLGIRIGVNTGEVVVDPRRPADLLVGDALNVAARLEQEAADGEILVGVDTYRLVRDEITLEPIAPLALKGKAGRLPAWRLLDTAGRSEAGRLHAPLVGRERELAVLNGAFDAVRSNRSCRMVSVIGSPGVGKSRLVGEFVRGLGDGAIVLSSRCEAAGQGLTFQPVAEILRAAAGIGEDDAAGPTCERLRAILPEGEPDRERIIERASAVLGLAAPASTEETFWAVRRIIEALARDRPVVLVHDDIHWGQPTFLDLLEHFVAWIRDAPVLVLGLGRPELRDLRPRLAEPGAGIVAEVLALDPLDAASSRDLVAGLLGTTEFPDDLAEHVLRTTGGNPLFLSETLRMLADDGILRREGAAWAAVESAEMLVPPTINALLSSRIERLVGEQRSVVERAAVIGHAFYRGAVAELMPSAARPGVDDALAALTRREMVREEDERWLDERVFRFHHVLLRDAAYRALLKEARADLHERFADWLVGKVGEGVGEFDEIVAFHLEQAHANLLELGPLDDPGRSLAARATSRLHSAGRRALAREDLPAAANLLRRALAPAMGDAVAGLEIRIDLAEALLSAGDAVTAAEVVEEIGLGAAEQRDERLAAWAVVLAAQLDNLSGARHLRATIEEAVRSSVVLAGAGDPAGEAKAQQVAGQAEALLGQSMAAEAALDRALVAARAASDQRRATSVLAGAPGVALWGPAPIVRASGRCLDVVRILRLTPGTRHVEASALRCQAVLEAMRGRADAARGILATCRVILEELGLSVELHETATHAGLVELLAGDHAAAERHLRAAQDGFRALGVQGAAARAAALLARALLEQGRDDEAMAATVLAEENGGEDLRTTATWLAARAEILSRRGDHAGAQQFAQHAVDLTAPTDALADRADALMALAAVETAAGDAEAGSSTASHARQLYDTKGHTVGVARAEAAGGVRPLDTSGPRFVRLPPGPDPSVDARLGRYASGRAQLAFVEAFNRGDMEALRALYDDDHVEIDRRAIGWEPVVGADRVVDHVRSWHRVGIGGRIWVSRVLAIDEQVLAIRVAGRAEHEGGVWETEASLVSLFRDGRFIYTELSETRDKAALRARFAWLSEHGPPAAPRRPFVLLSARAWGEAFAAGDWRHLATFYAPDVVLRDHRMGIRNEVVGADRVLATLQHAVSINGHIAGWEPIDVRSDRLLAFHHRLAGSTDEGGPWEMIHEQINVLDRARRVRLIEIFEDRAAMARRLDTLEADAASAGAADASLARPVTLAPWVTPGEDTERFARWVRAHNAGDTTALAALGALVTRRPAEAVVLQTGAGIVHAEFWFGATATAGERSAELVVSLADGSGEVFDAGAAAAAERFAARTADGEPAPTG